ncbi:MAG: FAD-binding oxidoreductase [Myxococcales bacterium]
MSRAGAPDVVVIGAGVLGASAAWHLAGLGARVTVLEREGEAGRGSTSRATGGFRAQFATEINVALSLLAREKLLRFQDELGVDPGFRPAGYLWLARTPAQLAVLRAGQKIQHAVGLESSRMLSTREIASVNPFVRTAGLSGAAYCPADGFIRPLDLLRGYLQGAQRRGARLLAATRPLAFEKDAAGRIVGVLTSAGAIPASAVVNAAGPWAAEVGRLAGLALPVVPLRRQVASTVPCAVFPDDLPMTIFVEDGFHLRVRDGRVLLLLPTPGNPADPFDDSVEDAWLARVARVAAERVPALAGVPIDPARSWAGLYEMSPDKHALVGALPACPNFFLLNGASGHGVMHAPVLGQLLAEEIVFGRARALDIHALRPSRFDEGDPNPASELL